MVKRLQKSVVYMRKYSTKYSCLLAVSYLTFTNEFCQLWSYWTKFHEIFTRYRSVIYAVNALHEVTISHSVLLMRTVRPWYCNSFSSTSIQRMQVPSDSVDNIFATLFGCYGNVPSQIRKQATDLSSACKALSYMVKRLQN